MTNEEIKNIDRATHMPSYARFDVVLENGSGSTVFDANEKKYIDFTAGIGVNSLGFSDAGWADAISKQAVKLQHSSNLYYSGVRAELTKKLCDLSKMGAAFMCNSGAEANECAIKIARKYGNCQKEGKNKIITLVNSFHGRTVTTLAATGQDGFHTDFMPFTGGFDYVPAGDINALKKVADDSVCAVMMELIQGEGGVVPLEKDYVTAVANLCKERGMLLLIDEVQTGIARTGTVFAFEQYGINPNVVTLAKGLGGGLPIGACLCSEELKGILSAGSHGSTFGGNQVSCAGANYVLDTVSKKEFLNEVDKKASYIKEKVAFLPHVKEIYGLGLMMGIELDGTVKSGEIAAKCAENGLLVLTAKKRLRFLPPLNITISEIDEGLKILEETLK